MGWENEETSSPSRSVGLSLALALVIAAFLPAFDAFGFVRRVGFAGTVQLFLASALYIDVTGLLLHLVLDNSNNERFSLLAGGVRSFVNHHADPQKIAATPGLHYAFTHLPVAAAIVWATLIAIYAAASRAKTFDSERYAPTAVFVCFASLNSVVMQFAHRWSHTPAFAVPTVARVLERAGLLIAPAKHARHHVPPHASNFSIMMGWADKLVNPFLRLAPGGPWSPVWLYVFVAWLVSPVFLTDPKVSRRFLAAWRALCLRCAPDAARGASRIAAGLVAAGALHHYGPRDVFAWHPIVASAAIFGLMADGPRPRPDRFFEHRRFFGGRTPTRFGGRTPTFFRRTNTDARRRPPRVPRRGRREDRRAADARGAHGRFPRRDGRGRRGRRGAPRPPRRVAPAQAAADEPARRARVRGPGPHVAPGLLGAREGRRPAGDVFRETVIDARRRRRSARGGRPRSSRRTAPRAAASGSSRRPRASRAPRT